jgi:phosphonate transport system substrate-binding protein
MILPVRATSYALLAAAMFLLLSGCDRRPPAGPPLRIGYMNCNSAEETLQRFAPMTRYLSEQLGVPLEAVPVDTQDFEQRYASGEFTFTHTNSLLYIILEHEYQLQLLATEKRGQFGPRTAGAIIVRRDSPIKSLQDLRGKRMIFGPQMAPTGYMAQYDLLLKAGLDPERDLGFSTIPSGSFKHEKLIYGVYLGAYDAAAAPVLDLETMTRDGKITADDFRILAQSEIVPYCTFGAAKKADPVLIEKFRQALLGLTRETTVEIDGERRKVLGSAWVDGFEALQDRDYDPVRDMAKRTNMPPYQVY